MKLHRSIFISMIFIIMMIIVNNQSNTISHISAFNAVKDNRITEDQEIDSFLKNSSFVDGIVNYLRKSQDNAGFIIPSMDTAYYIGMSLSYLENYYQSQPNLIENINEIYSQIDEFIVGARNLNGGYANWNGSRSSMESTFQAISYFNRTNHWILFSESQAETTLDFINSLQTELGGYFPLSNWDAPDVSSTYRAVLIKQMMKPVFPSLNYSESPLIVQYLESNFVPSFFINGASGYSEITGGTVELLATMQALKTIYSVGDNSTHTTSAAKFLLSLTSPNGGVTSQVGNLPTTGYTCRGLELYYFFKDSSGIDISSIFSNNYEDLLITYLENNKQINSGFTSSQTDATASLSSTFFVLESIEYIKNQGKSINQFDLIGVLEFLIFGEQPTFGYGEYPGDVAELSRTAMVIMLSKILNEPSLVTQQVGEYVNQTFTEKEGGFGFRPLASPRVKYTYYGIKASRAMGNPLEMESDISNFISSSEVEDGGFGQFPGAKLSYLSHTYWAFQSLFQLGDLDDDHINFSQFRQWLESLQLSNGMFGNDLTSDPSIISTFRALSLISALGMNITNEGALKISVLDFLRPDGGFVNTNDKSVSTMEATYHGILTYINLGISFNISKTIDYILSLQNDDGGFALRPGFSSRVTSTYYAVGLLQVLEKIQKGNFQFTPGFEEEDIFSPIIVPAFIPNIDTNRTIQGTYALDAKIFDPESSIRIAQLDYIFINESNYILSNVTLVGEVVHPESNIWVFYIGPFNVSGTIKFKLMVTDLNNNTSSTRWMFLHSIPGAEINYGNSTSANFTFQGIVYLMTSLGVIESIYTKQNLKQKESDGIKMTLKTSEDTNSLFNDKTINFVLLLFTIGFVSFLMRLMLQNALVITQNSIFLFRFILAIFVILIAKYSLGIRTYGLFGPSVIVISLLSLGPFWGMIIVSNIIIFLIFIRKLLNPFNLAVGFRIGILMIFSITLLGLFELIGEIYRISFLSQTVFIPIIITPWIADRFVIESDQLDELKALSRLALTALICLAAYFLMSNNTLVLFVATNPEVWIIMVLSLVYFGRFQSYTRVDKKRFQRLFGNEDKPMSILIRNRNYITTYNSSILFPLINKYNMKSQFEEWRVPTPESLAIISSEQELEDFHLKIQTLDQYKNGFVIKPSQSFGGIGIVVVSKTTDRDTYFTSGEEYYWDALRTECLKILQGEYLTSNTTSDHDLILIEERIVCQEKLASISVGLPDIRIIVFKGVPVMAMARLPTVESGGKANLKQGAIGASVNISNGIIARSEWKTREIQIHPDTKRRIPGYQFDNWQEVLATACLAQKASGLGYAGVDIVIDSDNRILVLEVNKRPGLEIQNINLKSILTRLNFIESNGIDLTQLSPIRAAQDGMKISAEHWEES